MWHVGAAHLHVEDVFLCRCETWSAMFYRPVWRRPAFFGQGLLPLHMQMLVDITVLGTRNLVTNIIGKVFGDEVTHFLTEGFIFWTE